MRGPECLTATTRRRPLLLSKVRRQLGEGKQTRRRGMGGTYDPKTNQMVWEFKVPLEEQLAFYRGHPPDALDGLGCKAISLPDYQFDGHGDPVNAIFEVLCRCGSKRFAATGWVDEDNDIGPPVTLFCDECEEVYDIFDQAKHGFNALGAALRGDVS